MKKRLGIFLFYDKDGRADRYIKYLLDSIRPSLDHLIIIVNGYADDDAKAMLSRSGDELVIRENKGLDIAAWKQGITEVCGKEKLEEYDTLVLFNDSFFGPFYPFEEIFSDMDKKAPDFWGLSVHGSVSGSGLCPYGYRPRYIQTYFLVFEKKLLHSDDFFSFWEKQPLYTDYNEAAEKFVAVLTQQFADLGYKWEVLSDTSEYESSNRALNFDNHSYNLYAMISEKRYPVIKRRSFYIPREEYLKYSGGHDLFRSLSYIEKNYDYDVSMIFEHIMRKYDPYDVKSALGLDYVLPDCDSRSKNTSVIAAHIVREDRAERLIRRYLHDIPEETDIVIFTDSEDRAEKLRTLCKDMDIRGVYTTDSEVPFLTCGDILSGYRYMCFVHDYEPREDQYSTIVPETERIGWENTIGSSGYIRSVTKLMDDHGYLGLLTPFRPHHGKMLDPHDGGDITQPAVAGLVPDMKKISAAGSSCFWCRTDILKILADGDNKVRLSDVMRLLPYAAARCGLATGWIYDAEYAASELADQRYTSDRLVEKLGRLGTRTDSLSSCLKVSGNKKAVRKKSAGIDSDEMKETVKKILPRPIKVLYYKLRHGDRS